jgi:hypothetical protein
MCRANWENPALIAAMQATRARCRHFEVSHLVLLPPRELRSCLFVKNAGDPFFGSVNCVSYVNIQDVIAY